jgi:hypothetical protein
VDLGGIQSKRIEEAHTFITKKFCLSNTMMRKVIGVTLLALLAGLTDGRELLRRDDHLQMEIEVDTSGQRRELGWGSGGFSWILCEWA